MLWQVPRGWIHPTVADEDKEYRGWIRKQRCLAAGMPGHRCQGSTEAHHAGRRGMGRRAHDHTCLPLCMLGHREWHSAKGAFADMDKYARREWADRMVIEMRSRYAALSGYAFADIAPGWMVRLVRTGEVATAIRWGWNDVDADGYWITNLSAADGMPVVVSQKELENGIWDIVGPV